MGEVGRREGDASLCLDGCGVCDASLLITSNLNMFDGSSPRNYRDSRQTQVLRSIESPSPAGKSSPGEDLLVRLLMLSIEIDRKDTIIRELLMASNNNHYEIQMEEMQMQCQRYQVEIKSLTETVQMLKENITLMQSAKSKEVIHSLSNHFNDELEGKVTLLEGRLRRAEEEKIAFEEQLKQLKLNQSMAEYKFIRSEQNQKGRVRELENQLITERTRADTERKVAAERANIIEDLKTRLQTGEANERLLIQQYEEKLRHYHTEFAYNETLKKSQIVSSEEKITASAQEIHRLNEEVRYLRHELQAEREGTRTKEKELVRIAQESKQAEGRAIRLEGELREVTVRLQSRAQELRVREKELSQKEQLVRRVAAEGEEARLLLGSKQEEAQLHLADVTRLTEQISQLMLHSEQQRNELRKLKRKPLAQGSVLCEGCRLKETGSASLIASQKSIRALNIQDIIQQTEQLFRSNRKIESLITRHESHCESSIHLYQDDYRP